MEFKYLISIQLKKIIYNKNILMQFFCLPLLLILIIGYLTSNDFSQTITSYQFYSTAVMLFMYVGYGINSSFAFIDRYNKCGNMRLLFVPLRIQWIYLSHIVSETVFGGITAVINLILIQLLFGVSYSNLLLISITYIAIILLSNSVGILLSLIIDDAIIIEEIFTIAQVVLCIMGGCFFSIESIANVPSFVTYISPIKCG